MRGNLQNILLVNRDVSFEYRRAVVPFCRVVGPVRVCLPYSRLLSGIPLLLAEFQNLRWN